MLITWGEGGGSRRGNGDGAGPADWETEALGCCLPRCWLLAARRPDLCPILTPTIRKEKRAKLLSCFLERKMGITGVPFGRTELSLRLS